MIDLVLMVIVYWLMVVIHEAGHIYAGRSVGVHVDYCYIGPYKIQYSRYGPPRYEISWQWGPQLFGGFVLADWPRGVTRHQWTGFLLGGVIANFLFGSVMIAFYFWILREFPSADQPGGTPILNWIAAAAVFSLICAIYNLIPFQFHSGRDQLQSDGRQLLDLWRPRRRF